MKSWFVYILLCDRKNYYIGLTDNLQRRLTQHRDKKPCFTKKFSHIKLVCSEEYKSRKQAEKRERQIKKWTVAKKKALIAGNIPLLKKLSKGL